MASSGGIRAGRAFVEISADLGALQKGLGAALTRVKAFGASIKATGQQLIGVGLAAAAPFGLALKTYADYESSLNALRTAANPTAEELLKIEAAISKISASTGAGPAEVASAITELLKAGQSVDAVLGGAAEAALEFATVAEMDVAQSAIVISDAMNVFGVDAKTAVDTLSKAADASSISVQDVAMSFSMASAVAKQAGLTIDETANAIAVLGQNGIKSSDAGTSLKTMLLRLQAPTETAAKLLESLHINVRDGSKNMKDMRGIIGELQAKLGGLDSAAKDAALSEIFGTDAIRAASIFLAKGTAGWDEFTAKMQEGLSVSKKFDMLMGGLKGTMKRVHTALQTVGIEIGAAMAPAMETLGGIITGIGTAVANFIKNHKELVPWIAAGVAVTIAAGVALYAFGTAIGIATGIIGIFTAAVAVMNAVISITGAIATVLAGPIGLIALAATAAGVAVVGAGAALLYFSGAGEKALAWLGKGFSALKADAVLAFQGIGDALKAGNIELAGEILWAGLEIQWIKGTNSLMSIWLDWGGALMDVFTHISFKLESLMINLGAAFEHAMMNPIEAIRGGFARIEKERREAQKKLADQQQAGIEDRVRGDQAAREAGEEKLAAAEAKLAELSAQAKAAADASGETPAGSADDPYGLRDLYAKQTPSAGTADDPFGLADLYAKQPEPSPLLTDPEKLGGLLGETLGMTLSRDIKPLPITPDEIDAGLAQSKRTIDVMGSFSAAALRGIGLGENVADRQLEETKAMRKGIDKLNDKARNSQLVFGA